MIEFKRLNHIQLCIPKGKEEEARKFYAYIIGLTEIPKPAALVPNGGLWFKVSDIQLHIGTEDEINRSKRHPAFEVKSLKAAREHLEKHNIPIKEEIAIPGQSRFSFTDPFGNRIELLELEKAV
jgi:catechol 2,3-dioxygenase-like lactoylglutathione lyase family enzyme